MRDKTSHIIPEIIEHYKENGSQSLTAICFDLRPATIGLILNGYYRGEMEIRASNHIAEMADYEFHICSHFGCGRILTLQESLYGNYCQDHQEPVTTLAVVDKYISI